MKKVLIIGVLCCVVLSGTVTAAPLTAVQQPTSGSGGLVDESVGDGTDPGRSVGAPTGTATEAQEPEYEVTVARVEGEPNKVRFTVTITDTKSLENLEMELSDGQNGAIYADSTDGFEEAGRLTGRVYEWDGETETPSVTIVESVPRANDGLSTDDAVVVETPRVSIRSSDIVLWEGDGFNEIYSAGVLGWGPRKVAGADGASGGVATQTYTAVGDVSLERVSRNETQFWVVETGNATVNGTRLATMLGASQQYLAGSRPEEVSIFALGDAFQMTLGAGVTDRLEPVMLVEADEPMTGPDNTWLHEYVHVQQSPISTSRSSNWWTEAIAEYQTARVAPAVTDTSPAESYYHLVSGAADTTALRVEDHPSVESSYERGSFVLLCLSLRIAQASGGNRTVQDVIEVLYEPDYYSSDRITGIVANQSNGSVGRWFERAVRSSGPPEVPSYQAYQSLSSRPPALNPMPTLTPEPTATPTATTTTITTTAPPTATAPDTAAEPRTIAQTGRLSPSLTVLALLLLTVGLLRRE